MSNPIKTGKFFNLQLFRKCTFVDTKSNIFFILNSYTNITLHMYTLILSRETAICRKQ